MPKPIIGKMAIWGGALATALLLLAGWLWTLTPMWKERSIQFESARWKATPADFSHASIRQRMVDDLLVSHPLIGMTRSEVVTLIGSPDNTGYFQEFDMVYALGQERHSMIAIDSEWLVIKLDESGRVTAAKLVTD